MDRVRSSMSKFGLLEPGDKTDEIMFLFPACVQLCFCKDCKRYIVCLEFTLLLHFRNFKVDFIKCCWPSLSMKTLSLCGAKWHTDTMFITESYESQMNLPKALQLGLHTFFNFTLPLCHCFVWPLIMLSVALWYILMIHFDTFTSSSIQKNPPKKQSLQKLTHSIHLF